MTKHLLGHTTLDNYFTKKFYKFLSVYSQKVYKNFTKILQKFYKKFTKNFTKIVVIRVGPMDLKHADQFGKSKTGSKAKTSNIRRPYGVCVILYNTEIAKGAAAVERNFTVYKVLF